ncbi:RNA polymerase sigma factor [Dethiothermospora halolimnae]|uniref:RNA polymerase sigma factor n=1 Tax=Dethiothermospora halolimnae TaxID=3114390 RepID=UPI003CCC3AE4
MALKNVEETIEKFQFNIYKYCYQMIRSKETAEDITQEVFIKFFNISKKKDYSNSDLYKIAHNKCIDHLRREKRKKVVSYEISM